MVLQGLGQNLITGSIYKRHPTPYLNISGKLRGGVFCEDLEENWQCYNSTTLYSEKQQAVYQVICVTQGSNG